MGAIANLIGWYITGGFGAFLVGWVARQIFFFHGIRRLNWMVDVKSLGEWAVVTGGSEGIGFSYAKALGERGMKVLIISRSEAKLQNAKSALVADGVQCETLSADFSKPDEAFEKVKAAIVDKDVGVLVNNVGVFYARVQGIGDTEDLRGFAKNMIDINVMSVLNLTALFLPLFTKKSKGAIINIASSAALFPIPKLAIYSCSKVFVDYFTSCISEELKSSGSKIIVQSVLPFYVKTAMIAGYMGSHTGKQVMPDKLVQSPKWVQKIAEAAVMKWQDVTQRFYDWSIVAPDFFVNSALDTLSYQDRTFGCFPHAVQGLVFDFMPRPLLKFAVWARVRRMEVPAE